MSARNPPERRLHLLFGLVAPAAVLVANFRPVFSYTVDDAYISFRYARNLAHGAGLVYNLGERVEGYTNLAWTLLLAGAIRLGLDPVQTAKVLGACFAVGALGATFALARMLRPFDLIPCLATWLLASSIVLSGHAVFGLEGGLFVFLIVTSVWRFFVEMEAPARFPWSGPLFALAALTRPEAPLYLAVVTLGLGARLWSRQSLYRCAIVAAVVASHLLWRHAYYGAWVPNTLLFRTGDLRLELAGGTRYVGSYLVYAGPVALLAAVGAAIAVWRRERRPLLVALLAAATLAYVCLIGADWMVAWRYLLPLEPFLFLLAGYGARTLVERRSRPVYVALAALILATALLRVQSLRRGQREIVLAEEDFWDRVGSGLERWFAGHPRGSIAIGDIGFAGWVTDAPIYDTLGLVDRVTTRIVGGAERHYGPAYVDRFFSRAPRYYVMLSGRRDCRHPTDPTGRAIFGDEKGRFDRAYRAAGRIEAQGEVGWCIFERNRPRD